MLKPGKYEVLVYEDGSGKIPYENWLDTLDFRTEERISARVARMETGQFGDVKALGGGLYESRFFFGAGYRVYFGEYKKQIILLLNGGDKATQKRDIAKAKEYWLTYLEDRT